MRPETKQVKPAELWKHPKKSGPSPSKGSGGGKRADTVAPAKLWKQ